MRHRTDQLTLEARANTVRRLIRTGHLQPHEGLALLIQPTTRILQAERKVPYATLKDRAHKADR